MTGKAEVNRLKQVLDATFQRSAKVGTDPELQSDLAQYLCVLVSGFFEKAISELLLEHARRHGGPSVQRFIESRTRRLTNINSQRLEDLLGAFDSDWRRDLGLYLIDEPRAAVDSILNLRNSIAHGQSAGVTYHRVKGYYQQVKQVVDRVADLCAP
jgi:hypothetical protein